MGSVSEQVEQLSLGVFHPAFAPIEHIQRQLRTFLPSDIHVLASQQLGISLTRWPDGRNVIITDFATREEVIQRYFDGALSNNLPFSDCPSTITVSPFTGTVDICPPSTSASMLELNAFNASFQFSTRNFFLGLSCVIAPSTEVGLALASSLEGMLVHYCRQGYLDALRFLERRGLTKEPVLWTLVSKEPPAPAHGTRDTGQDGGQKEGLSLNWAVPSVLVKDVPNFKQLSPELEAALEKTSRRDPRPWARFRRSTPGKALTYLLLPCTLPFEYVYFRGRRLVLWLPDLPADLRWMRGELRRGALWVCSGLRDQLLARLSPPVSSPLPPEAAPPTHPALKRVPPSHQA
ncbi:Patatin-like phospholipase domain-containing protein 5 [Myotis brandtii]|uniref:Patatin-like phospholipase domain-containing protein 5 n=1 Tax=Myotis brandtii TaxID=109478 RepID=S7MIL1_MYOBR|nr:Patatin-like phospholipase domain-containing protein 5 [Myotis brandtii]